MRINMSKPYRRATFSGKCWAPLIMRDRDQQHQVFTKPPVTTQGYDIPTTVTTTPTNTSTKKWWQIWR